MRKLTPELLDHLPHNDPGAMRSRRDLRRINRFMGNDTWIIGKIPSTAMDITEIGAGDGALLAKISKKFPQSRITAYDLAPRPLNLPPSVDWQQGDIFQQTSSKGGGVLIANLILHHFTDQELGDLAPWISSFETLIFNEPLRSRLSMFFGMLAHPLIHPITRHDMRVSIEAGFLTGELPQTLGLERGGFTSQETTNWKGSMRIYSRR